MNIQSISRFANYQSNFVNSNVKTRNVAYATNSLSKDTVSFSAKKDNEVKEAGKKSVYDLGNVKGKRALVRVDVNVPFDEQGNITDDTRIQAIVPTIRFLQDKGAKVVLAAHLGRPKGEVNPKYSLEPVAKYMSNVLGEEVKFIPDAIGKDSEKATKALKNGQVALLENVRFYKQEEKNDPEFAKELAKMGDFYVNDAFGAAHRAHSSTEGVAKILSPAVSGLLMEKEISSLSKALNNPERPFTAIVGGSKVSTKIGVLENLLDKMENGDNLIVGGGMTYTFANAKGLEVGKSICEKDQREVALNIMDKASKKGVNFVIADDILVTDDFSGNGTNKVVALNNIPQDMEGVDIGPKTMQKFANVINNSKTIIWNGPVGVFENDKFANGTKAVAKAVMDATAKNNTVSVLGGGDTVAAVKKFNMPEDNFTHVSTGGGASLEFMEGKVLPGVDAIDDK